MKTHRQHRWTPEETALLATLDDDAAVAARVGVTLAAVARKRYQAGIHAAWRKVTPRKPHVGGDGLTLAERWADVDWTLNNVTIAEARGVSRERVRKVRQTLGLPPFGLPLLPRNA